MDSEDLIEIGGIVGSISIFLFCISLIIVGSIIYVHYYQWNKEIGSYFDMSDKASTIQSKLKYYDIAMDKLQTQAEMSGNSALFFPTPTEDFYENYMILKSLRERMYSLSLKDSNSLEYQMGMQQITGQEYDYFQRSVNVMSIAWCVKQDKMFPKLTC